MRYLAYTTILLTLILSSCNEESPNNSKKTHFSFEPKENTGLEFVNTIKESAGLNHFIWDSAYNGAGSGLADLDNDGLLDVVMLASYGQDKIFKNLGDFKFEDVTASSGLKSAGGFSVSSGVTFADINNDGLVDIYISKFSPSEESSERINEFYINKGNLQFVESASQYGIANSGYTTQSAFADFDKDGDLDLYVMNQPSNARKIRQIYKKNPEKEESYISNETSDCYYENLGNGKFKNVSQSAGIRNFAYGLGLLTLDFDNDGWTDVFIANDYDKPDYLYINQKNGTFKETALESFAHISNFSMGADAGDINNDMLPDIGVLDMAGADHHRSKTNMPSMDPVAFWKSVDKGNHFQYMHNCLHLNTGDAQFQEVGYLGGIAKTDWSWSLLINDFNNDAYSDIYITNGIYRDIRNSDYIENTERLIQERKGDLGNILDLVKTIPSTPMRNYLFMNQGNLKFKDVSEETGLGFKNFSNGAAIGDLDNDGDLDIITNNVNSQASILENKGGNSNNWLRINIVSSSRRTCENTKVKLYGGNNTFHKELSVTRGYMSASERVLHFGLGDISEIDSMVITWPDNNESILTGVKINQLMTVDQSKTKKTRRYQQPRKPQTAIAFSPELSKTYKHQENDYDPFQDQILLPYEVSKIGPYMAKADLNGDGLQDLVVGAAKGSSTALLFQKNAGFTKETLVGTTAFEDGEITLFDANGDNALDIYVTSSGYESDEGSDALQDRLYINNGKGEFKVGPQVPVKSNTSKAIPVDIDSDGDLDVFVFGRYVSKAYPNNPKSYLLTNDGKGNFVDSTEEYDFLNSLGMVTDATLTTVGGEEAIALVSEWGSPQIITLGEIPALRELGKDLNGMWFGIKSFDLDGDGDEDFVLGNLGLNSKFKASKEKPFKIYADDFDTNGKADIVLATYYDGKEVPVRGRQCSTEQLPELQSKFKSFESFASAELSQIYNLDQALELKAETLHSGVLWNTDAGWEFKPLPIEAQISVINDVEIVDFDKDGLNDIIIAGNLHSTEVETTRMDASRGLVLRQDKEGEFTAIKSSESGLFAKGDAKDMVKISIGGKNHLAISMNDDYIQFFEIQ